MKKKIFISILTLFLASFIVFASGGRQAQSAVTASTPFMTPAGRLPLVTQPTTISLGIRTQPSVTDYYNNHFTRYVQQQTGLTIHFDLFASGNDGVTQLELIIASGQKLPDIVSMNVPNWRMHGDSGVFVDLNPYHENLAHFYNIAMDRLRKKYGNDSEVNRIRMKMSSSSCKRFAYPAYNDAIGDAIQNTTRINKAWLDKLGLKTPTTTAELRDVLIAFRDRDPNGNGKNDEIPVLAHTGGWISNVINWMINAFVYFNPAASNAGFLNATNGRLWTPYTTEE